MNIKQLQALKSAQKKIAMVTCYDYWSAKIIATTAIDCVLIGDSLSMIMHGHKTTIPATIELMATHTQAVARAIDNKLIIADLPFLSYRKDINTAMHAVSSLMQAGAQAIKLEGAQGNEALVKHIVESGVPVMGHIGLTPQAFHQLGGFKVQGKGAKQTEQLLDNAKRLEEAGCFAIVLECIPQQVAQKITQSLAIPTIGIGAGPHVDGQILVLQDLLGMNEDFQPKFLKTYLDGFSMLQSALNNYSHEIKDGSFPSNAHCYEE